MNSVKHFFDFIKIEENGHKYYFLNEKGEKEYFKKSVTQAVSNYHEYFDSMKIARKQADKFNITIDEVLQSWKDKSQDGRNFHLLLENSFLNNYDEIDLDKIKIKDNYTNLIKVFVEKFKLSEWEVVDCELVVGDEETKIAGTLDVLVKNNRGEIEIWDWKTSGKIYTQAFGNKKMFYPFDSLPDCNYIHYCLQLSFYKFLVEKKTNLKVSKLRLVHFNCEDNYYKFYTAIDFSNIIANIYQIKASK